MFLVHSSVLERQNSPLCKQLEAVEKVRQSAAVDIAQEKEMAWRGVAWSSVLRFQSCIPAEAYGRRWTWIGGVVAAGPSRRAFGGIEEPAAVGWLERGG